VMINEFGAVGLDHLLVESVDDDIVVLKSGCICCTIRGDLKEAILLLLGRRQRGEVRPFSRLVIESTGLADPAPILATLSADPMLKHHLRSGNIITVVDLPNGIRNIESYSETSRQIAVADRLVVTKSDLADRQALDSLTSVLTEMNPTADLIVLDETSDPARSLLVETLQDSKTRLAEVARWLSAEEASGEDHEHPHEVNRHGDIHAFVIEAEAAVPWPKFALWLSMLIHRHGENILRLKGLINIEGAQTPVFVHGVQHLIHKPLHLDAWPEGRRRTRIVMIGKGFKRDEMQRSFDVFTLARRASKCL